MFNKWYLLWTFIYGAQLGQQAKESAILHLLQKKQNKTGGPILFVCTRNFHFSFSWKKFQLKAAPEEKNTLPLEAIAGSKIPHSLPTCSECCFKFYFHSCSCKQSIDVKCNEYGPNERGFKFDGWGREINKQTNIYSSGIFFYKTPISNQKITFPLQGMLPKTETAAVDFLPIHGAELRFLSQGLQDTSLWLKVNPKNNSLKSKTCKTEVNQYYTYIMAPTHQNHLT